MVESKIAGCIQVQEHIPPQGSSSTPGSTVAHIRADIATSYMSAQLGLCGFASGTTRHRFITARMERMNAGRVALHELVGEQAMTLVAETWDAIPEHPTRTQLLQVLRHDLGESEETTRLLARITTMWEVMDELIQRFGMDTTRTLIDLLSGETHPYGS